MVSPIPDDYPRVSANLAIDGAAAAIDFYTGVLGFTERMRFASPDGKIGHAELELGDSLLMVADEYPDMDFRAPGSVGGTPVTLSVYVEDVDATYQAALEAGATGMREPEDQFWGDRSGQFEDPWGHRWNVTTHIRDVSEADMHKAMEEMGG